MRMRIGSTIAVIAAAAGIAIGVAAPVVAALGGHSAGSSNEALPQPMRLYT
jgi:hypothetical protein